MCINTQKQQSYIYQLSVANFKVEPVLYLLYLNKYTDMDRSLLRISSIFLLVIIVNHIVLATNARVLSGTSNVDDLAGCPPEDTQTTLVAEKPKTDFTVEKARQEPEGSVTSGLWEEPSASPTKDEIDACPPIEN